MQGLVYEMLRRKPKPKWKVYFENRTAYVMKNLDEEKRSRRWLLVPDNYEGEQKFFRSRREAFHFFKTGERFEVKPVYAVLGGRRGTKRIR